VWHEESTFAESQWDEHHWRTEFYMNGDTSIGSYLYHKIYEKITEEYVLNGLCWPFIAPVNTMYFGATRQDIPNKKIYLFDGSNPNDTLLYDFNLSLGDTLPYSYDHMDTAITVILVDSIFDGDNYRKRFYLSSSTSLDSVFLIEGIGASRGLFGNIDPPFEGQSVLHCFQQNDSIKYRDNCPSGCDLITVVNNISEKNISITISPNPAHDNFTITLNREIHNGELKIYDVAGRMVMEEKLHSQISSINCQLSSGLYFLKVLLPDTGEELTGKIAVSK
jgi:hypothetical protein